ncbi:MAG: alanine racemase, partial [Caulobacter sp.]
MNDLHTPCLILDRGVLEANIDKLLRCCRTLDIRPRPHMKTPKSNQVAQLLADRGVDRFTVSTIRELETLAAAGFNDLFYAVPLERSKVVRVAPLLREGRSVSFLIDDLDSARACAQAAAELDVT